MRIGYARVSTGDQSTALQLKALKESGCERIFQETASGAQRDRPQLARAIEFVRSGDSVVVWKMDRLARSLKQLIDTVEDLGNRGIGFLSLTENIDTSTPGGKLIFHVFGALAEFERGVIRERTMAGLDAARREGRIGGRPRALGDKDIKAAKALMAAGDISMTEISKRLGISPATLYRAFPGGRGQ